MRLSQMQCGQQTSQSDVSYVQNEISALAAVLEKDHDELVKCQDNNCERMFIEVVKILSRQVMQVKELMYEETKQTVRVYKNG